MAGFSLAAIDEILGRLLSGPGEASIWLGRDYSIADLRRGLEALRTGVEELEGKAIDLEHSACSSPW
ncbi:MAG TPA: hypothetical protein PLZ11_13675 [Thauera sp.]|nr:hypothetical protein [Thauera sp.]